MKFDYAAEKNIKEHNANWPQTLDPPYSRSGKTVSH